MTRLAELTYDQLLVRAAPFIGHVREQPRDSHGRFDFGDGEGDDGGGGSFSAATTGDAALASSALGGEPTDAQLQAVNRYGGDGGYVINADLREQGGDTSGLTAKNQDTVEQMDSLMASSPLGYDTVVYRGIGHPDQVFGVDAAAANDLTGLTWRDHAYVSTAVESGTRPAARAQMRILAPAGTPGFSHPKLDSNEIVLGRGLTFKVVADHGKDDRLVRQLDVVVVPP